MSKEWIKEPKEAIARLCALQAEVAREVLPRPINPNDCFCLDQSRGGLGSYTRSPGFEPLTIEEYWRNSGDAIEWIEKVVRAAIKRRKKRCKR